jgi:hypothetical protein
MRKNTIATLLLVIAVLLTGMTAVTAAEETGSTSSTWDEKDTSEELENITIFGEPNSDGVVYPMYRTVGFDWEMSLMTTDFDSYYNAKSDWSLTDLGTIETTNQTANIAVSNANSENIGQSVGRMGTWAIRLDGDNSTQVDFALVGTESEEYRLEMVRNGCSNGDKMSIVRDNGTNTTIITETCDVSYEGDVRVTRTYNGSAYTWSINGDSGSEDDSNVLFNYDDHYTKDVLLDSGLGTEGPVEVERHKVPIADNYLRMNYSMNPDKADTAYVQAAALLDTSDAALTITATGENGTSVSDTYIPSTTNYTNYSVNITELDAPINVTVEGYEFKVNKSGMAYTQDSTSGSVDSDGESVDIPAWVYYIAFAIILLRTSLPKIFN